MRGWGAIVLSWVSVMGIPSAGVTAWAQPPQSATERYRGVRVREVRLAFEGENAPEAARALIDVAPGDIYRPDAVRRSVRQLFALGAFSDIKVEAERVGEEVDVLFRLFPRLEVEAVRVNGLERAGSHSAGLEDRLVDASRLRPGDPLDVDALATAAERMQDVLYQEGYLWATVDPEASFQSPSAIVVFHVEPRRRARIGAVEISGAEPHVEAHVRRELALDRGALYSRTELDERLESITTAWHERGYYGATIDVEAIPDSSIETARVDLNLGIDLGPRVQVEVLGGDFSESAIQDLVPLYREARFTEDLIEESRANLEGYLRERGHRDAAVTVGRESVADRRYLFLRFHVEPGPVYEVAAIEIEGLDSLPEADVQMLLSTRSMRRFRSAPFQEKVWMQDLEAVRGYLEREGFHRSSVTSRQEVVADEPERLILIAVIEEGPRALIDSVEVQGTDALDATVVLSASGLEPGSPFAAADVVQARDRILTEYYNEGFRRVDVQARTSMNDDGTRAAVAFRVGEGPRTRVNRVIISGLAVSRQSSIQSLVTVKTGAPLSPVDILETRQKLVGSGLFRSVSIEALPADPRTNRADVLISVVEGPRTTFAYGFGFEEQQLLRAELEVTRRNLFGLNRTVSMFTRASVRGGRFITTYRQPDSIVRNLPLFVSFYAEEEERTSFDYNRVGLGLQISKPVSDVQNLFFRYRYDRTKVFDLRDVEIDEIDRRFRPIRIGAVSAASVTDERDDPLNPRDGQYRIMDVEWSATALGTEAPYLKGLVRQFFYWPLPHGMVAAVGLRLGVAHSYRERLDGDGNAVSRLIPIAERFFAGGATTLRGFALDEASPKEKVVVTDDDGEPILVDGEPLIVDGDPIGGNVLSLVNLELRFPVWGNLSGVAFSDNGTVYRDLDFITTLSWRYNVGFGFRYDTPLGPLRVDYGLKIDRRTRLSVDCPDVTFPCTEPMGRWHVSLGHAF